MREPQKVVVHYLDNTLLRGHTRFFFHEQERIEVADRDGKTVTVNLGQVKAVFFVKEFEGDARHTESQEFPDNSAAFGERIRIVFVDGEVVLGRALDYRPEERGFYLQPADPQSNNQMIFVPMGALKEIQVGELTW